MIISGDRIHECKEDGDLPADFLDAHKQGALFVHCALGWLRPWDNTTGVNGNTYCYDPADLGQLEVT